MKKIKNPWIHKPGFDCFACSPDNPIGLHMEFWEDGDEIVSRWTPGKYHQGWVDVLHGGIQSTIADEIASWVVSRKLQTAGMTCRMSMTFRKAILVSDGEVVARARLREKRRNIAVIDVELSNAKGEVCTQTEVEYYTFSKDIARERFSFEGCQLENES